MPCVHACAAAQVVKAITAGLFMNAAQYQCTEYDPTKTNDAGSNVYRLLRHVQPRECLVKWLYAPAATVVATIVAAFAAAPCRQDSTSSSRGKTWGSYWAASSITSL